MSQPVSNAQFVQLLTQSQRPLYGFIFSLVPVPQDAEDILQETNATLWEQAERFEAGTDFFSWARTVARFKVLDHRKKKRRVPRSFDEELLEVLAKDHQQQGERPDHVFHALKNCREKLSDKQREMIDARYASPSVSVHALALRFNTTPAVVSQTLYRIRISLLQCIQRRIQSCTEPLS